MLTSSPWSPIKTTKSLRANNRLQAWMDEPGYAVIGAWQHDDGRIAVVYTDEACRGAFAVSLVDAERAAGDYSEWCSSTTDLADASLALLVRAEPTLGRGHRLLYTGSCSPVLSEDDEATEAARIAFVERFPSIVDAIAFEHGTLGCGREFLPADALVVLDGGASTVDYYHWLEQQLDASEEDQRQPESV